MSKVLKASAAPAQRDPAAGVHTPRPGDDKVVDWRVLMADRKAQELMDDAVARGREIVARARSEAADVTRQAREDGFAEGLARLQDEMAGVAAARARLLDDARRQSVDLAIQLAEKILRQRLARKPEALAPLMEQALAVIQGATSATVRVHPSKVEALESRCRQLRERDTRWQYLTVAGDAELDVDACLVESEFARLDAGVESQLAALGRLLHGAMA